MKRRQNNLINSKNTEERSILRMLCPSLLGIMVCLICLAGMSWAWFTAGVQSQSTITAGSYTLNETVKVKTDGTSGNSADAANTGALEKAADGTYALDANTQYVVTLKPSATPKNGGYCIFKITYKDDTDKDVEVKYCTAQLSDTEFNFTINNGSKSVTCRLIAAWGTPDAAKLGATQCNSDNTITLNGGAQDNNSSDQNSDSNAVTEPSTAGDNGTSGNDSSDQNGKNSQQTTDKNTDNSSSKTDTDSTRSQSGTE